MGKETHLEFWIPGRILAMTHLPGNGEGLAPLETIRSETREESSMGQLKHTRKKIVEFNIKHKTKNISRKCRRPYNLWGFPGGTSGNEYFCQSRRCKRRRFDHWVGKSPEEGMATHSSILAWRIPWTEEPGG